MKGGRPPQDLNIFQVTSIKVDLKKAITNETMKYDMDEKTLEEQFNLILNSYEITYGDIYKSLDLIVENFDKNEFCFLLLVIPTLYKNFPVDKFTDDIKKDKEKYDNKKNEELIAASYIKENGHIIGITCNFNVCDDTKLNKLNGIISHKSLKQPNTFYRHRRQNY